MYQYKFYPGLQHVHVDILPEEVNQSTKYTVTLSLIVIDTLLSELDVPVLYVIWESWETFYYRYQIVDIHSLMLGVNIIIIWLSQEILCLWRVLYYTFIESNQSYCQLYIESKVI